MKNDVNDISAIVLSFNSSFYIEKCIRNLHKSFQECNLKGEIIVVENGSADGSVEILKKLQTEFAHDLQVIFQKQNTGTTRSRNRALRQVQGNFILILDSDAYMNSAALEKLICYQNNNLQAGLIAPRLIYPDGRFQLSVDVFPTLIRKFKRFYSLRIIEKNMDCQTAGVVDYAISACWLLRKEIFLRVGLLDEKIFYSPEDVDYCIRVWKNGYQVHYVPQVSIVHDAQELSKPKGLFFNKFTFRHIKGLLYLFIKHKYVFSLEGLYKKINRAVV